MGSINTSGSFSSLSFSKERGMKGQRSPLRGRLAVFSTGSCKFKFVVVIVVLLTIYCASHATSMMGWNLPADQRLLSPELSARHRYTVLINTWKRYELLKQTVAHYATCNNVDAINVIWSEPEKPSKALSAKLRESLEHKVKFKFNINEVDELNNRFKPIQDIETDALFSIDDDVLVPCQTMDLAFRVWLSAPDQTVGFVPRMHWAQKMEYGQERYRYGGWWSVWWTGTYSMVLTKASFIHKKYLEMYTNQMPTSLLEFVKRERNCEDIAMSFLVANATHAPPIWVKGRIYEIGSTGISSLTGHKEHRTNCVNYFTETFGHMPLVSTRVKVIDAASEWLW
ncbi:unnamed protein product [Calypogeia fissa]